VPRHENAVLRRHAGRVRYEPADRTWFAALARLVPRRRWAEVFPATPATLLAWHRRLAAKKYGTSKQRKPGRPSTSADLVHWHYVTDLDHYASQPYIAAAADGSFVLADENLDLYVPIVSSVLANSHLYFLHYPNMAALANAQPNKTFTAHNRVFGPRFFSVCNEGTPDIHGLSADGLTVSFGFHYLSDCLRGLDREAFGTLTNFASATARIDTVRDNAVNAAGYAGKHGGRDDITWHDWRFSLQEAQLSNGNLGDFAVWRFVLYDYTNHQAYTAPITTAIAAVCHGNPKVTMLNGPGNHPVILISAIIFRECAPPGPLFRERGELLYTVPAQ
jgi:hypothetical protein